MDPRPVVVSVPSRPGDGCLEREHADCLLSRGNERRFEGEVLMTSVGRLADAIPGSRRVLTQRQSSSVRGSRRYGWGLRFSHAMAACFERRSLAALTGARTCGDRR